MKKMIFISRHQPTPEQHDLAEMTGFQLIPVGDMDAFAYDLRKQIRDRLLQEDATHISCVHPAIAMTAFAAGAEGVGIFENAARAAEGEKPTFEPVVLHVFGKDDEDSWYGP